MSASKAGFHASPATKINNVDCNGLFLITFHSAVDDSGQNPNTIDSFVVLYNHNSYERHGWLC